jgi:hypothetical protein
MDRVLERATEGPMLVTRISLLISATAAVFVLAAHTGAEAGFLCKRGMGGFQKSYYFTPPNRISKIYPKAPNHQQAAKSVVPKSPVEKPANSATIARAKPTAVADAVRSAPIATPTTPIATSTAPTTSIATPTGTCVVKEYLDTGVVRFRDVCTKEWAINSIDNDAKSSKIRSACLTKQNSQNGVVMFKDVCTGEWAMNTAKQIALANAQ